MKLKVDYEFVKIAWHKGGRIAVFKESKEVTYNWFGKMFLRNQDSRESRFVEVFFPVRSGVNFVTDMSLYPSGKIIDIECKILFINLLKIQGL